MTLSLLAFLLLPFCLKLVLDPKNSSKALQNWGANPALQMLSSAGLMLAAFLLALIGGLRFTWEWSSTPSWIAVLLVIKAVVYLFPSIVAKEVKMLTPARLPIVGFLGLLCLLGLVYIDLHFLAGTL